MNHLPLILPYNTIILKLIARFVYNYLTEINHH